MNEEEELFHHYNPFISAFTALKLKYIDYDNSIKDQGFLTSKDKINVFINLESVFKFISMIKDVDRRIMIQRDMPEIMISNILNLAAHYKRFFTGNGLNARVFLYHTAFESTDFAQYKYNDYFRSYYLMKYNNNPKFVGFTELMQDMVIPDVKTYCAFLPDVYYVEAKDVEGSLVPFIIACQDPSRKNFIITSEFYDSQYADIPMFMTHYIHRTFKERYVGYNIPSILQIITKKQGDELEKFIQVYSTYAFYTGLIAVLGDRSRSIDGISGVGPKYFADFLRGGMAEQMINTTTTTPELIGEVFKDDTMRKDFINNYYCSNISQMIKDVTDAQRNSILTQLIDRSDINAMQQVNIGRFAEHPIMIEGLLH